MVTVSTCIHKNLWQVTLIIHSDLAKIRQNDPMSHKWIRALLSSLSEHLNLICRTDFVSESLLDLESSNFLTLRNAFASVALDLGTCSHIVPIYGIRNTKCLWLHPSSGFLETSRGHTDSVAPLFEVEIFLLLKNRKRRREYQFSFNSPG